MTTNKITVTDLDFTSIKSALIQHMKTALDANGDPIFTDYNYAASGLSTLMNLLAYNTHINALSANFLANELFLDTASKRSSVISLAKMFGYTPASRTAAKIKTTVTMSYPGGEVTSTTWNIPKGTQAMGVGEHNRFIFITRENQTMYWDAAQNKYVGNDILFYEGVLTQNTVTYNRNTPFVRVPNVHCDTTTLRVYVKEDETEEYNEYIHIQNVLEISDRTNCFFIQESINGGFEIYFGSNGFGYTPANGSTILLEYIVTNGAAGNNVTSLKFVAPLFENYSSFIILPSENGIVVGTSGGKDIESIESIRHNTINHYGTQNRAVTHIDYQTIIRSLNSINVYDVRCWGGETELPPKFNSVIVCVLPQFGDALIETDKTNIINALKEKSVTNMNIIFKQPDFIYITLSCIVRYDKYKLNISTFDLEQTAKTVINNYANEIYNFDGVFRDSVLTSNIVSSHQSIVSCELSVNLTKTVVVSIIPTPLDFSFNNELSTDFKQAAITSSTFYISAFDSPVLFKDNGLGIIDILNTNGDVVSAGVGTVNYSTGDVKISAVDIKTNNNAYMTFTGIPKFKDIASSRNHIIKVSNINRVQPQPTN
jgi:hypothetical protein